LQCYVFFCRTLEARRRDRQDLERMGDGPTLQNSDLWLGTKVLTPFEEALLIGDAPLACSHYKRVAVRIHITTSHPCPIVDRATPLAVALK